jgi:hypothetical protein
VTGAFTAHVAASQLAELVLDERHQLIDGTVITASPGLEQRGGAQGLIRNDLILPLRQIKSRVAVEEIEWPLFGTLVVATRYEVLRACTESSVWQSLREQLFESCGRMRPSRNSSDFGGLRAVTHLLFAQVVCWAKGHSRISPAKNSNDFAESRC